MSLNNELIASVGPVPADFHAAEESTRIEPLLLESEAENATNWSTALLPSGSLAGRLIRPRAKTQDLHFAGAQCCVKYLFDRQAGQYTSKGMCICSIHGVWQHMKEYRMSCQRTGIHLIFHTKNTNQCFKQSRE